MTREEGRWERVRSEQRAHQVAAGRQDRGLGGTDGLEELQQTGAGLLPLRAAGEPDGLDQPREGRLEASVGDLKVGHGELGVHVGGTIMSRNHRAGVVIASRGAIATM